MTPEQRDHAERVGQAVAKLRGAVFEYVATALEATQDRAYAFVTYRDADMFGAGGGELAGGVVDVVCDAIGTAWELYAAADNGEVG